jgi:hypothetical protein
MKINRNCTIVRHSVILISANLMTLACFAAPAAIILMPASSIGAPAPFPKPPTLMDDIKKVLADLKNGTLKDSLAILRARAKGKDGKGSAMALEAFVNAVNEAARNQKIPYRLVFAIDENLKTGDSFEMKVYVTDLKDYRSPTYDVVTGTNDFPAPDTAPAE